MIRFFVLSLLVISLCLNAGVSSNSYIGIAQFTLCPEAGQSDLPEITIEKCTQAFVTEAEARKAAFALLNLNASGISVQASSIWQEITGQENVSAKVLQQNAFVSTTSVSAVKREYFYRGMVIHGFAFEINGEKVIEQLAMVTKACATYDEAFQAARKLAPVSLSQGKAKLAKKYNIAEDKIDFISVKFDVDLSDRNDENFVPKFRGMVVHGLSFEYNGTKMIVQKSSISPEFDNYNDAFKAAHGMAKNNMENGKTEISAQYGIAKENIDTAIVIFDVQLM